MKPCIGRLFTTNIQTLLEQRRSPKLASQVARSILVTTFVISQLVVPLHAATTQTELNQSDDSQNEIGEMAQTGQAEQTLTYSIFLPMLIDDADTEISSDPEGEPFAADNTELLKAADWRSEKPLHQLAREAGLPYFGAVTERFTNDENDENDQRDFVEDINIVKSQFNLIVPGNAMKWDSVHKSFNKFDFSLADETTDFAESNHMAARGHVLVWHKQNPQWLVNWAKGTPGPARKSTMLYAMRTHIDKVVKEYKGKVIAWDVVGEAFNDDGSVRETIWSQTIGYPEYIEKAFQYAHAADPNARLFYDDFDAEWTGAKSDAIYNLIKDMKRKGIPIHGMNFQSHFHQGELEANGYNSIAANIKRFSDLGLEIYLGEVDFWIWDTPTTVKLNQQAKEYVLLMDLCLNNPQCKLFNVWGVSDSTAWLNYAYGKWNNGMLFDRQFGPKPAYSALRDRLARTYKGISSSRIRRGYSDTLHQLVVVDDGDADKVLERYVPMNNQGVVWSLAENWRALPSRISNQIGSTKLGSASEFSYWIGGKQRAMVSLLSLDGRTGWSFDCAISYGRIDWNKCHSPYKADMSRLRGKGGESYGATTAFIYRAENKTRLMQSLYSTDGRTGWYRQCDVNSSQGVQWKRCSGWSTFSMTNVRGVGGETYGGTTSYLANENGQEYLYQTIFDMSGMNSWTRKSKIDTRSGIQWSNSWSTNSRRGSVTASVQ